MTNNTLIILNQLSLPILKIQILYKLSIVNHFKNQNQSRKEQKYGA